MDIDCAEAREVVKSLAMAEEFDLKRIQNQRPRKTKSESEAKNARCYPHKSYAGVNEAY